MINVHLILWLFYQIEVPFELNDILSLVLDFVVILPGGGAVWDEAERVGYTVYCGRG